MLCRSLTLVALTVTTIASVPARADVIDDWNESLLDTFRNTGGGPGFMSRSAAMTHAAIFDSVNSVRRTHEPIVAALNAQQPCAQVAAAAQAAHDVLVSIYPERKAVYDEVLRTCLDRVPDGEAERNGRNLGRRVARAVVAAKANDRSDFQPVYRHTDRPGFWQITDPLLRDTPVGYGWGKVHTWALRNGRQFRPPAPGNFKRMPALLTSQEYAEALNEVKLLGERDSAARTPEQTEIAWFWANDRAGTYHPPGHLLEITQTIADQTSLSLDEKARLFALVSIGMADTSVAVWDCKFETNMDLWRPVTAIRRADEDGNPATEPDADWEPLLDFTPPFPAFPSGHAAFGAVHAAILQDFFGTDEMTFTVGTDEPIVKHVQRTYHSFSEAARENGVSRVYLGVHYRFDADSSYSLGSTIGHYVYQRVARPLCPADYDRSGEANGLDMSLFTRDYFADRAKADFNGDGRVTVVDMSMFVRAYLGGCRKL